VRTIWSSVDPGERKRGLKEKKAGGRAWRSEDSSSGFTKRLLTKAITGSGVYDAQGTKGGMGEGGEDHRGEKWTRGKLLYYGGATEKRREARTKTSQNGGGPPTGEFFLQLCSLRGESGRGGGECDCMPDQKASLRRSLQGHCKSNTTWGGRKKRGEEIASK